MKTLRTLLASLGFGKKSGQIASDQTNLIPIDRYVYENKHHLLEDAEHQLHKVDERHEKIVSASNSLKDPSLEIDKVQRELVEIDRLRHLFLQRTDDISNSIPETWETVKKEGKVVNDALLSALARAERLLGLPVGEG